MKKNICLATDSYKIPMWTMLPGTERVYAYFEARKGAKFDEVLFSGLQIILMEYMEGVVVTKQNIDNAEKLCLAHFGKDVFNREGWEYILNTHGGKLPLEIKAVPEGSVVPINNVLMTVENTDDKCFWLTNFMETMLSQIWYPCTVGTLSYNVKKLIKKYLGRNSDGGLLDFGLQDFGYRGASSQESAGIGGMAHLINFKGTDTLAAMEYAMAFYDAPLEGLAYSVVATEHSIMTSQGKDGELTVLRNLLDNNQTGILSVVADSYDIYNFTDLLVGTLCKEQILARDGVFVVRPDSITPDHPTPELEMIWLCENLWKNFGGHINSKGYKVINDKVRLLWGDGIDIDGIDKILNLMEEYKFAAENMACFGMGGGLLQKVNRDTLRFAFKCSAQKQNGVWKDIYKSPKDVSKASKKGKLKLIKLNGEYVTCKIDEYPDFPDELRTVFLNGEIVKKYTFAEVRENALK